MCVETLVLHTARVVGDLAPVLAARNLRFLGEKSVITIIACNLVRRMHAYMYTYRV